jgi:WD40 repeat protein
LCDDLKQKILFVPSNQTSIIDCILINEKYAKASPLVPTKSSSTDNYGMLMLMKVIKSKYLLLASYENGDLALFDLKEWKELSRLSIFKGNPLLSFDYSVDKNIGVAGCSELDLQQFSINENKNLCLVNEKIELKNAGLNCIKIRSNDSKIFASAGWDSRIRIYGLKKAKLLCVLDFHNENVNTLDFSKETLVCGSNDGLISFWNLYND